MTVRNPAVTVGKVTSGHREIIDVDHPFVVGDTVRIGNGQAVWTVYQVSRQHVSLVRQRVNSFRNSYRCFEGAGISRLFHV